MYAAMIIMTFVQAACLIFTLTAIQHLQVNAPSKMLYRLYLQIQSIPNNFRFKRAFLVGNTISLVDSLHQEQGSAIHIGSVLMSNTIEGFQRIYGTSPKHGGVFKKSAWYTFVSGYPDLFSDRDPGHHATTRKLFGESFTPKSIGRHERTMVQHVERLMNAMREANDSMTELHDMFRRYTTDLMFNIIIGKQLDCLGGRDHVNFVSHVPSHFYWATVLDHLGSAVGFIAGAVLKMIFTKELAAVKKEAAEIVNEQLYGTHERRDMMVEVLSRSGALQRDDKDLFLNFRAVLSASIHTTSTALTITLFFIISTPHIHEEFVKELKAEFPDADAITSERLARLPYLNAVITESLRLFPPVPMLGGRISPGTTVDGVEVPRGVEMFTSIYSLHTNKIYFERPTEFLPERWLGSVDPKAKAAYHPFSTGSRSCPGKHLALQALRLTIAHILIEFNAEYVGTVKDWVAESNCHAIYDSPPLLVNLNMITKE